MVKSLHESTKIISHCLSTTALYIEHTPAMQLGKQMTEPLMIGKRTWRDRARWAGKGLLAMGVAGTSAETAHNLYKIDQAVKGFRKQRR
jgi:hypothetical protein